eukprot:scaffold466_cov238-Pinguiococcus_pyrenoidosus.AAC.1
MWRRRGAPEPPPEAPVGTDLTGLAVVLGALLLLALLRRLSKGGSKDAAPSAKPLVQLAALAPRAVPLALRVEHYFDLDANPFAHAELLTSAHDVVDVLNRLEEYVLSWLQRHSSAHRHSEHATFLTEAEWPEDTDFKLHGSLYVFVDSADRTVNFFPDRLQGSDLRMEDVHVGHSRPAEPEVARAEGKVPPFVHVGVVETSEYPTDPGIKIWSHVQTRSEQAVNAPRERQAFERAEHGGYGLHVCRGAQIFGGVFDTSNGGIYVGEGASVEANVVVKGPVVIGAGAKILSGAYLRGPILIGQRTTVRCEVKNAVFMDHASLTHPGYVGDSVLGHRASMGCQAVTCNLGLLGSRSIQIGLDSRVYDLGRRKIGCFLGDFSKLGSNSVTDPGTFVRPHVFVYPLCRLPKGFYGPNEIIKTAGGVERLPLDLDRLLRRQSN